MKCPRCDQDLAQLRHRESGAIVDVCRKCNGIWFDAGELDQVLDVSARDLQAPKSDEERATALCPKCYTPMAAFHYPQTLVTVDMCRACHGIWLDGGELQEIATVRLALQQQHRLELYAPVRGIKGALLRFVDAAITRLTKRGSS